MAREVSNIVPWAEIVPDAPYPMSAEEFERLPDDPGWRYELVYGRLVRMPAPGLEHGEIAGRMFAALFAFVQAHQLGRVFTEVTYRFHIPGEPKPLELAPDVSYLARGRGPQPGMPAFKRPGTVAPDLAVEIASPEQYRPAMSGKAREYLQTGTRLVWVLYPQWNELDVWWQGKQGPESQTLKAEQQLDGRDVLPGFTHPVARFFPALDEA